MKKRAGVKLPQTFLLQLEENRHASLVSRSLPIKAKSDQAQTTKRKPGKHEKQAGQLGETGHMPAERGSLRQQMEAVDTVKKPRLGACDEANAPPACELRCQQSKDQRHVPQALFLPSNRRPVTR